MPRQAQFVAGRSAARLQCARRTSDCSIVSRRTAAVALRCGRLAWGDAGRGPTSLDDERVVSCDPPWAEPTPRLRIHEPVDATHQQRATDDVADRHRHEEVTVGGRLPRSARRHLKPCAATNRGSRSARSSPNGTEVHVGHGCSARRHERGDRRDDREHPVRRAPRCCTTARRRRRTSTLRRHAEQDRSSEAQPGAWRPRSPAPWRRARAAARLVQPCASHRQRDAQTAREVARVHDGPSYGSNRRRADPAAGPRHHDEVVATVKLGTRRRPTRTEPDAECDARQHSGRTPWRSGGAGAAPPWRTHPQRDERARETARATSLCAIHRETLAAPTPRRAGPSREQKGVEVASSILAVTPRR